MSTSVDPSEAPPSPASLPPVNAEGCDPQPRGRSWLITSLILNAVSLLSVMILPHVSALPAIAAGACAGVAVRGSTYRARLGIASLIVAAALFIACVIYTIIAIQAGFAYLENQQ